jgi:uncharacterized protein (TIGR02246 family)
MLHVMEFDATLDAHLTAIRRRDLDAFAATVHKDVTVVLPNGKLLRGRDDVAAFHRDWFADGDWRMELTPEGQTTAGDTAVALFAVDYHDVDGAGAPYHRHYRLALVFARAGDEWLLLHDQNTDC